MSTTRSRRSLKLWLWTGMKSCGPQRLDRRRLADRARVSGRIRLDRPHRLDQRLGAAAIADPPAGHAIGLRDAVDGQSALVEAGLDLCNRRELEIGVNEVLIHVVFHDPD